MGDSGWDVRHLGSPWEQAPAVHPQPPQQKTTMTEPVEVTVARIDERVGTLLDHSKTQTSLLAVHEARITQGEKTQSWMIGIGIGVTGVISIIGVVMALV